MPDQLDLFAGLKKTFAKGTRPRARKAGKKRTRKARSRKPDTRFGVALKKKPAKRKARKPAKKKARKPRKKSAGIASSPAFKRGFLAGIAARSHMK